MINLDKIRNAIGEEIFGTILLKTREQLQKQLAEIITEMNNFTQGDYSRYNRLSAERVLIMHRLEAEHYANTEVLKPFRP